MPEKAYNTYIVTLKGDERLRDWLITLRKKRGLSEKYVAEALQVAQPHYHRIEHGEGNPSVKLAMKIGEFFGIKWTRLFESDEEKAS